MKIWQLDSDFDVELGDIITATDKEAPSIVWHFKVSGLTTHNNIGLWLEQMDGPDLLDGMKTMHDVFLLVDTHGLTQECLLSTIHKNLLGIMPIV